MPNGREIGTPRDSIVRPDITIGRNGIPSNRIARGSFGTGRGITDQATPSPIDRDVLTGIANRISQATFAERGLVSPFVTLPDGTTTNIPEVILPKNPFETLGDAFAKAFGGAQYNPPLRQQAFGYGSTGGTNWTLLLILGAIGVGAYFYFR